MDQFASPGSMIGFFELFSAVMFTLCLYFSLTYFEHLKNGDDRLIKQSKSFAVISLALALIVPAFYLIDLMSQT